MADIQMMIKEFSDIASNPRAVLQKHLAEGKKVVGCFPLYTPEEMVHAAGMVPKGLWGGQVTPTMAGKYNPIFTCSIMRSCLEYGMTGVYKGLAAVMMPMLCDTFRGMSAGWPAGVKDIPLVAFIHPQNRADAGALAFMTSEYQSVRKQLEDITGCIITDESLIKAIDIYNAHSAVMRDFTQQANDHLDIVTPIVRHHVFKSATFIPKDKHTAMVRAFIDELAQRPVPVWKGKKVILSGITAEPDSFIKIFSENNIAVVGDDLAQESRQYRTPIPNGNDPMQCLAQQWINRYGCSTAHEASDSRSAMLVAMARETGAHAVAVCLMRFCDVEEYDYPMIANSCDENGLYCLSLEIDQSTQDNGQSRTKIQSFAEM